MTTRPSVSPVRMSEALIGALLGVFLIVLLCVSRASALSAQQTRPPSKVSTRNPFEAAPPVAIKVEDAAPVLSGTLTATMLGSVTRIAALRLNDHELRVVAVGDSIGRWKVVLIDEESLVAETRCCTRVVKASLRVTRGGARLATHAPLTALPGTTPGVGAPADLPLLPPSPMQPPRQPSVSMPAPVAPRPAAPRPEIF
jgi:hypothetical protein